MFLKKVHVKNFRGLQDVVLEFNQSLSPSVFPVGSLNGGGKSTLLQLIFILLRCAADPQKHHYIQNILKVNLSNFNSDVSEIIRFLIHYQREDIDLQFLAVNRELANYNLESFYQYEQYKNEVSQEFGSESVVKNNLDMISAKNIELRRIIQSLRSNVGNEIKTSQNREIEKFINDLIFLIYDSQSRLVNYLSEDEIEKFSVLILRAKDIKLTIERLNDLLENLAEIESSLYNVLKLLNQKESEISTVREQLENNGYYYITILSDHHLLFAQTSSDQFIFELIARQIYLACPLTQVFLFLEEKVRMQLLGSNEGLLSYVDIVDRTKQAIGNWYTYEFSPVKTLAEVFQRCIKEDTKIGLASDSYGNSLMRLKEEVNQFFTDKTVSIEDEFQSITFKKKGSDQTLLPEDLSHGELKKFGIYLWLKYMEIKDAIVLMDEVEIGFHPDWQYEIIHELLKWSNNNQFILATHSYDLCSAVTPAHVNEIEPRLISERKNDQPLE
ncbi:AAA family ATPase [Limnothrix redekei]|uniref:AAA family ATPase n=1 Tax=Limnothrix redekei LRLZ20PSL1 TaxID=3112953 RepID=A0ABW7CAS9_9CYAN